MARPNDGLDGRVVGRMHRRRPLATISSFVTTCLWLLSSAAASGQWLDTLPPAESTYWWTLTDEISPGELRELYLDRKANASHTQFEELRDPSEVSANFSEILDRLEQEVPRDQFLRILAQRDFSRIAQLQNRSRAELLSLSEAWSRDIYTEVYLASALLLESELSSADWQASRRYLLELVAPTVNPRTFDSDYSTVVDERRDVEVDDAHDLR